MYLSLITSIKTKFVSWLTSFTSQLKERSGRKDVPYLLRFEKLCVYLFLNNIEFIMWATQCVLTLLALCVGLAHSWDIAVSARDELRFYTNGTMTSIRRLESRNLTALAYDEVHNMMLYVDKQTSGDIICGYDLCSAEDKCFTERNGRNIHGLTYDPVTESVFFTDTNERSVNSISLKPGSKSNANVSLLIKMDDGIPRDIVVDSCKGYIYWLSTNLTKPTIERARLDGTGREIFENITSIPVDKTSNLEPHSLAINQQSQAIFWMEPATLKQFRLYTSKWNTKHKTYVITFGLNSYVPYKNPSNTLAVTKQYYITVDFQFVVRNVYAISRSFTNIHRIFTVDDKLVPVGIAANFRIKDQIQGISHCDALSLVKTATECDVTFCVHGMKDDVQLICKCAPGYTGERCDVSVCENYCLHGSCGLNDKGLPECRCNAGYSGDRCEVYTCHGYCLNNGDCSLNEKSEPVCQCKRDYVGDRCNVSVISVCENYCLQGNCSVNNERLPECRCNAGYSGDRCEVYACHGYCSNNQGSCSINDEGLPECRCNAGYSGDRCEVYACHGYCLNNGDCSLNEQSEPVCQCKGDYVGDRCEVSLCENYCLQGNCSVGDTRLPECRCNPGYLGARCEEDACHGYCLNNGDCYVNEEEEPSCQCEDSYEGTRCEADKNDTITAIATHRSEERNLSLSDFLSSLKKHSKTVFVVVEQ